MKQIQDLEKNEMLEIFGGEWMVLNGEWVYVDVTRGKDD